MEQEIKSLQEKLELVEDEITSIRTANVIEHNNINNSLKTIVDTLKRFDEEVLVNLEKRLTEKMDRVEAQTTKTNGRVGVLEMWRWIAVGCVIVLTPIVVYFANQIMTNTGLIRNLIQIHSAQIQTMPSPQIK